MGFLINHFASLRATAGRYNATASLHGAGQSRMALANRAAASPNRSQAGIAQIAQADKGLALKQQMADINLRVENVRGDAAQKAINQHFTRRQQLINNGSIFA